MIYGDTALMRGFRIFIVIGALLVLTLSTASAQTMYVNDVIKITMRTGPGINHKVIAMLESGQQVEVMEARSDWTHIRLPDGKDGWALTRFLTTKLPNEVKLQQLETSNEEMETRLAALSEENEQLRAENETLLRETAEARTNMAEMAESYETLKAESSDFLKIKTAYEEAASQLSEQREKAEILAERLSKVDWKGKLMWFLGGALVFLLGFLIGGFQEKGSRRRSPYF